MFNAQNPSVRFVAYFCCTTCRTTNLQQYYIEPMAFEHKTFNIDGIHCKNTLIQEYFDPMWTRISLLSQFMETNVYRPY